MREKLEHLEGSPLHGPMPVERAVRLGREITRSLEAAHRQGIAYPNLKAADIIITPEGLRLLDRAASPRNTADSSSDIYGVGAILYEMVTGQRAGHQRVRLRHAGLEAIVRKCMSNHPADRYQSLANVEAALGTVHKKGSRIRYAIIYALLCAGIAIVTIAVVLLQD